jgi:phage gp37-like protein
MTEIDQVEDLIIATVKARVSGLRDCATWQGPVEDLLSQPKNLPAVWVIYTGENHEGKTTIGSNYHNRSMKFTLALIVQNLKSRQDGARGAYEFIEGINNCLTGLSLSPLNGFLWPVRDDLIDIGSGVFIYGLEFERRFSK